MLALRLYCKELQDLTALFKIDNTSTVSWVNKQSGPDREIFTLAKQFWEFSIDRNINVVASYIESKKNKVADKESRKIRDNLEKSLKDKHFENLNREFGEFTIDLFATRINSKCRRYYSYSPEPEAAGTDAFLCNWNTENFYAFPPFSLISRVLQKIENENAEGILIVPAFTTQPWFPRLLRLLIKPPVKLPNSRDSLYFPFRRKEQPQLPNMKLMACLVSGDHMKTKVFQQRLQIFSSTPGELGLNPDMEHILENGLGFVLNNKLIPCIQI